jgi:SNF2 family DNA or RNA helicase
MTAFLTRSDDGSVLEIKFEGRWSEIVDSKDKVREIPGRRWDGERKIWTVPCDAATADRLLRTINPEADDDLMEWLRDSMTSHEQSLTAPLPNDAKCLIPWATQRMPWQPEVVNDEKFNGALPYQRAAIRHMADHKRVLLADDMGLGKTFEALSAVEEYILGAPEQPQGPRLVVAPSSVLGGWNRELNRWLNDPNVQIVDAKDPTGRHKQIIQGIADDAWVIVNWEQLRIKRLEVKTKTGGRRRLTVMKEPLFQYPQAHDWSDNIKDWDLAMYAKAERQFGKADPYWLAVIADEAHRAKNPSAQQTKGLHRVTGVLQYAATGTPIMNSPDELWSLLRWLYPNDYHERGANHMPGAVAYWPFFMTYVDHWEDQRGRKVVTGVKNPEALRHILKDKLIRRTAKILDLKGRKRFFYDVPMTATQEKLYKAAEKDMWLTIEKDAAAGDKHANEFITKAAAGATAAELMRIPNGAARFVRLQQIVENSALVGGPESSGNMDDFMQKYEDSRPEPWIVFCKYRESCDILAARLRKAFGAKVEIYNGDVSTRDRTEIEDSFQRGEIDVIVGTIAAMYQGITLTRGHLQHWISREVVPAINEQGESRQDRLGQQERVNIYIPQAIDTVAAGKVRVINRRKEGIVKTVIPQDQIQEVNA